MDVLRDVYWSLKQTNKHTYDIDQVFLRFQSQQPHTCLLCGKMYLIPVISSKISLYQQQCENRTLKTQVDNHKAVWKGISTTGGQQIHGLLAGDRTRPTAVDVDKMHWARSDVDNEEVQPLSRTALPSRWSGCHFLPARNCNIRWHCSEEGSVDSRTVVHCYKNQRSGTKTTRMMSCSSLNKKAVEWHIRHKSYKYMEALRIVWQ